MPPINRRQLLAGSVAALVSARALTACADDISKDTLRSAAERGRRFLVKLFDKQLDLLPEFAGCPTYWLYHDNYLAAAVLETSHPELAAKIRRAIAGYGVRQSGKIEIVLDEARDPLPFRNHRLIEVKTVGDKIIKTEILGDEPLRDWQQYADLLLLAAMHNAQHDRRQAREWFEQAMVLWDGLGFHDRVVDHASQYAAYKCALAILAASKLDRAPAEEREVVDRLLAQQRDDGGWITDYSPQGEPAGQANVETTSLAVLALDSLAPRS